MMIKGFEWGFFSATLSTMQLLVVKRLRTGPALEFHYIKIRVLGLVFNLIAVIFETGAMPTPTKSQNPIWTSPIAIFISLQSGLLMDLINTPISRVSCPNVENLENKADQFWASLVYIVYSM